MSSKFVVNGQTYNSLEEMPPAVRASFEAMGKLGNLFADNNQNGVPDIIENAMGARTTVITSPTIIYEGKAYNNIEELPPEARAKYDQAMNKLADNSQNGVPDVLEGALQQIKASVTTNMNVVPAGAAARPASGQGLGPIIVLGTIAIVLAVTVGILLMLLLARGLF